MDKIGLHIVGGFRGDLGRPHLVKLVDVSKEYVREVRQATGPACIIIVRWIDGGQQPLDNPVQNARNWFARHEADMRAMAPGDLNVVFEGYNETDNGSPDSPNAVAYCAFEVERLRLMHQAGFRAIIGNFSVGTPHESVWAKYKPMLDAMCPGDFLGLHEYWENAQQLDDRWLCGRWTKMPELAGVPVAITECARGGPRGWHGSLDPAGYLAELERYDAIMAASPNVLGGVVYTAGATPDAARGYDPSEIWPQVVGRYSGVSWTAPGLSDSQPAAPQPQAIVGLVTAPGVVYRVPALAPRFYRSERNMALVIVNGRLRLYIVVHDTEGPRDAAFAWWASPSNPYQSSAHDLVDAEGICWRCIPYDIRAHHCGGSHIAGYNEWCEAAKTYLPNANDASIGIELEYPVAPASPAWPQAQVDAAVAHIRELVRVFAVPRERVLRHGTIDPANRSDPRNLDWEWFLNRIYEEGSVDAEIVRNAAWNAGGIPYNKDAAFPRFAREHDLGNPETGEFDFQVGDRLYRGQGFGKAIVYARVGDWEHIETVGW